MVCIKVFCKCDVFKSLTRSHIMSPHAMCGKKFLRVVYNLKIFSTKSFI